jgi:nucleoside-diphosphate-sugar epimerase
MNAANTGVLITTGAGTYDGVVYELTRRLVAQGLRVTVMTPGSDGARRIRAAGAIPAYSSLLRAGEVRSMIKGANAQVVINLAPQQFNLLPTLKAAWNDAIVTEGTSALVEAAQTAGVEYLIYTSYAYIGAGMSDDAETFLRAAAAAEKQVLNSGVPAVVLRFGFLYASTPETAAVRAALKAGRGIEPGANVPVNFTYATDAAEAITRALETRPTGVTLNVVDDTPATTAEFMQYFAQAQGLSVSARPSFLSDLFGGGDKRLPALMRLPAHADNAAAKSALGWQPRFRDYRAGIDDLLLSWRAEEIVR